MLFVLVGHFVQRGVNEKMLSLVSRAPPEREPSISAPLANLFYEHKNEAMIVVVPSILECSRGANASHNNVHQMFVASLCAKNLFTAKMFYVDSEVTVNNPIVTICVTAPNSTMAIWLTKALSSHYPTANLHFEWLVENNISDYDVIHNSRSFKHFIKTKAVDYVIMLTSVSKSLVYFDRYQTFPNLCIIIYRDDGNIAGECGDYVGDEEGDETCAFTLEITTDNTLEQYTRWRLSQVNGAHTRIWVFAGSEDQRIFWVDANITASCIVPQLNELDRLVLSDTCESPRSLIQRMINAAKPVFL